MMYNKEIQPNNIWSEEKINGLNRFISNLSKEQSEEQIIENEVLGIHFELEDYVNNNQAEEMPLNARYFVQKYLEVLGIKQKDLASYLEMKPSNLSSYLSGKKRINIDLAYKFSEFFKNNASLWIRLQFMIDASAKKGDVTRCVQHSYKHFLFG